MGHPLADAIPVDVPRLAARQRLGLAETAAVVAVLPGSRRGEIQHIAPTFLQAVALLARQRPELKFVLPVVPGLRSMIEPMVAQWAPDAPLQVLDGQSHDALAACDVTLIASGTATLEAALFKRPMVISYKISGLSWQLMKRMGYLPWVGLPNILLRDFVVPERLQHDATPEQLSRDVLDWLDHPAKGAGGGSTLYRTSPRSALQYRAGCYRCHRPSHRKPLRAQWPWPRQSSWTCFFAR